MRHLTAFILATTILGSGDLFAITVSHSSSLRTCRPLRETASVTKLAEKNVREVVRGELELKCGENFLSLRISAIPTECGQIEISHAPAPFVCVTCVASAYGTC